MEVPEMSDQDDPTELDLVYDDLRQAQARIEALENALRERDEKLAIYHAFLSEAFPNGAKLNFSVDDLEKARAALLTPEQEK
jgi:hypothetical protein